MPKDLGETRIDGEVVFAGRLLKVHRDRVRLPDGNQALREYIRHPGAVAMVALFEDGRVLLERQFRYPLGREFIEIPAGKLEPGEEHLATAKRELLEETGYVAAEWRRLGLIHNAIGYSDEGIEIWLARGLELRGQQLAQGEFLEVFALPLAEAQAMARDGRITDVKTIAGLLWMEGAA
ncbi:MAG: NUDIX hydrolase [Betaproteobacteria bacterium]|nr:NUDIX hydrolase [Betaproteobacteria bacterium]